MIMYQMLEIPTYFFVYNTMSYYIRNYYISQEGQVRNFSKYLLLWVRVYLIVKYKTFVQPALTTKIEDREIFMKGIDYSYYYEQNE